MIKSFITPNNCSSVGDIMGKVVAVQNGKIVDQSPSHMHCDTPDGLNYMFKKNGSEKDITIFVIDRPNCCTYAVNVKGVDTTSTSIEYVGPKDVLPALMCTGLLSGMSLVAVD